MKRALVLIPLFALATASSALADFREINQNIFGMD